MSLLHSSNLLLVWMQSYSVICSKSHHRIMQYLSDDKPSLKYMPQIDVTQCYQICMNVVIYSHLISMSLSLWQKVYIPRLLFEGLRHKNNWNKGGLVKKTISREESILEPNLNSISNRTIFSWCHIKYRNSMAKGNIVKLHWYYQSIRSIE